MEVGSLITTTNSEYGNGEVVFISEDKSLCTIKFENKELPIMCSVSTKKTIHLESSENIGFKII